MVTHIVESVFCDYYIRSTLYFSHYTIIGSLIEPSGWRLLVLINALALVIRLDFTHFFSQLNFSQYYFIHWMAATHRCLVLNYYRYPRCLLLYLFQRQYAAISSVEVFVSLRCSACIQRKRVSYACDVYRGVSSSLNFSWMSCGSHPLDKCRVFPVCEFLNDRIGCSIFWNVYRSAHDHKSKYLKFGLLRDYRKSYD